MTAQIEATGQWHHAAMTGLGAYRPERVVPNSELVDAIDSSDEWIQERSGIRARFRAAPDESVVDMAERAAREALSYAGLAAADLDSILVATVTHRRSTPAAAPELAARLGVGIPAMDISAACAGYCHAISLAADQVHAGTATHVLVVGVEKLSDFTDPTDRGTAFIFGDGAGAAIVSRSATPGIAPTAWGSDGERRGLIATEPSWVEYRERGRQDTPSVADGQWPALRMDGPSVFRWAVWSMVEPAQQALAAAGIQAEDLSAFVPHQANIRIIDSLTKALKLPAHVAVARDIADSANTSAASVPLAMEAMVRRGEVAPGGLALQIGFGAGLVWAAQVVRIPERATPGEAASTATDTPATAHP